MKIGRMAQWYRWIEYAAFGRALENRRFAFLPRLVSSRRVLILGEGDGRTLARLLTLAPSAHFDVVELSPEMIALARKRTNGSDRVTFHCEDARGMDCPAGRFDAIVTNFFIDCFDEGDARRMVRRLANTLRPDGIWLMSEFTIPPDGWRRWHAQLWIWTMYRFFRATTGLRSRALPPIDKLMRESGMQRIEQETERAGLMVSEVWKSRVGRSVPVTCPEELSQS